MTRPKDIGQLPRRTVEEIVARYELEPDLCDLYVEGPRDRALYSWYINSLGLRHISVFEIESVEIPSERLVAHGLASGHRSRVIALALELDFQFSPALRYVRCIADSDFDFIFGSRISVDHILYTDYTSADSYNCKGDTLGKVLRLGFDIPEVEINQLFESMVDVLKDVFIVRAANLRLDWGMEIIPFTRCCAVRGSCVAFDSSEYVSRCLQKSGRGREQTTFEDLCCELRAVCVNDPRQRFRGEDFFELVGWYLKQRKNWSGYRAGQRSIMPNFMAASDDRLLADENLFVQLGALFRQSTEPS